MTHLYKEWYLNSEHAGILDVAAQFLRNTTQITQGMGYQQQKLLNRIDDYAGEDNTSGITPRHIYWSNDLANPSKLAKIPSFWIFAAAYGIGGVWWRLREKVKSVFRPKEQAVIIQFQSISIDLAELRDLELRLRGVVAHTKTGRMDDIEISADGNSGLICMFATDVDALFALIKPILATASFMRGAEVTKLYGAGNAEASSEKLPD